MERSRSSSSPWPPAPRPPSPHRSCCSVRSPSRASAPSWRSPVARRSAWRGCAASTALRLWRFLLVEPLLAIVLGTLVGLALGAVGTVHRHAGPGWTRRPRPGAYGAAHRRRHRRRRPGDRRTRCRCRAARAAGRPGLVAPPTAAGHHPGDLPQPARHRRGRCGRLPQPQHRRRARPARPARPCPRRPGAGPGRHLADPDLRPWLHPGHREARPQPLPRHPPAGPRRRPGHPDPPRRRRCGGGCPGPDRRGQRDRWTDEQAGWRPADLGSIDAGDGAFGAQQLTERLDPDGDAAHGDRARAQRAAVGRATGLRRRRPVGRGGRRLLRRHPGPGRVELRDATHGCRHAAQSPPARASR